MVHQFHEARTLGPVPTSLLFPWPVAIWCCSPAFKAGRGKRQYQVLVTFIPFVKTLQLTGQDCGGVPASYLRELGKSTLALPAPLEEVDKMDFGLGTVI